MALPLERFPQYTASRIIIQSPFICKELGPVFEKLETELFHDTVEIDRPFSALFFERDLIYWLSKTVEDQDTKDYLALLCNVTDEELGPTIDLVGELQRERRITLMLLWTLFPPAKLVVAWENGYQQEYRVTRAFEQNKTTNVLDEDYPLRAPYYPPPPESD